MAKKEIPTIVIELPKKEIPTIVIELPMEEIELLESLGLIQREEENEVYD